MTQQELSQLYQMNCEIQQDVRHLKKLLNKSVIAGLPHTCLIRDREFVAAEIAYFHKRIDIKLELSAVERNRLNRYIAMVDDALVRQVLSLRFVNGLTWNQVAWSVGGDNTADSVRMICKRFLGIE